MSEHDSSEDSTKHVDLSLAPYGKAVDTATKGIVAGAGAFLSRICLPVAEEMGLLLKEKVHEWRSANVLKTLQKAEEKYEEVYGDSDFTVHPRLLSSVVENVSWLDNDQIQDMWAGLLVSSCTANALDDSNLIFIDLLSQVTRSQAALLNHVCLNSEKEVTQAGWIAAKFFSMELDEVCKVMDSTEFHRIDLELDHLRSMDLITGGFNPHSRNADVTPTALALNLFVRAQGFRGPPEIYFGITPESEPSSTL